MQNITYQESSQHNIMKVDDTKFGTRDKRIKMEYKFLDREKELVEVKV